MEEGRRKTLRSAQGTGRKRNTKGAQYMYRLMYSHPPQFLIRRKSPSWDHLDGVLLQSSGTKHTHRPLRGSINIPLSQRYLCCILDWCSVPGGVWGSGRKGTFTDKALWWLLPKSVTSLWTFALHNKCTVRSTHRHTSKHMLNYLGSVPLSASLNLRVRKRERGWPNKTDPNNHSLNISHI